MTDKLGQVQYFRTQTHLHYVHKYKFHHKYKLTLGVVRQCSQARMFRGQGDQHQGESQDSLQEGDDSGVRARSLSAGQGRKGLSR